MLLLTKYTVLYKENEICCIILLSLPSRERGLKFIGLFFLTDKLTVAPFAGAWIEILYAMTGYDMKIVAPFAGAWIEIYMTKYITKDLCVAPFAGAWIEMLKICIL